MMTRRELAQLLFQYDPEVTPHRLIDEAERELDWAIEHRDRLQSQIASLEDDALYEIQGEFLRKRSIEKRLAKSVVLPPEYDGDRRTQLPRQPLEAGETVTHGPTEIEYALGTTVRRKLAEVLYQLDVRVEDRKHELQDFQVKLALGDLVLPPFQTQIIDRHMSLLAVASDEEEVEKEESVCWSKEGF